MRNLFRMKVPNIQLHQPPLISPLWGSTFVEIEVADSPLSSLLVK